MACNKCGHTKTSPCACKDHGLTTPCSYTECKRDATTEVCEDIQCAECVQWCQDTFCVTSGENTFCVNKEDRLDLILQRMALFIANPGCVEGAISHLFSGTIASTSVELFWTSIPTGTAGIKVYRALAAGAYTLAATLTGTATTHTITGLTANTAYKFKVTAAVSGTDCDSVEVYITTKA